VGEVAGEEGDGWNCVRCGTVIKQVTRWQEMVGDDIPTGQRKDEAVKEENRNGQGRVAEESSIEEVVTPDTEEAEDEAIGEEDSDEGENLFG